MRARIARRGRQGRACAGMAGRWRWRGHRSTAPQTLLVVDCLTLWLTNLLMPSTAHEHQPHRAEGPSVLRRQRNATRGDASKTPVILSDSPVNATQNAMLFSTIQQARPVVLVGNEIGLGVIPLGRECVRLWMRWGGWNQDVCRRVPACDLDGGWAASLFLKNAP